MNEDFLQYIWANSLFTSVNFISVSGRKIEVLDPGRLNKDSGPDFFYAQIRIDGIVWIGNVEIHLRNNDWNRHGHQMDKAYDNVILSVVHKADVKIFNSRNQEIETIILNDVDRFYHEYLYLSEEKQILRCKRKIENIDQGFLQMVLQTLAVERLEKKCTVFKTLLTELNNDWEECLYRLLCKYWAGNVNAEPFYQLSMILPYRLLRRYADSIFSTEALLLGCSGLLDLSSSDEYVQQLKQEFTYLKNKHELQVMNPSQWKFMRIHPNAFPTLRLALLAGFLKKCRQLPSQILETPTLKEVYELLDIGTSEYWQQHYRLGVLSTKRAKKMGEGAKKILFINAIIPFVFIYGKEWGEERYCEKAFHWLETCSPEDNYITREWRVLGIQVDSALTSQALIQLTKEYCELHGCLKCRIGLEVLKQCKK